MMFSISEVKQIVSVFLTESFVDVSRIECQIIIFISTATVGFSVLDHFTYISMIQEKEIAGPSVRNSDFPNMLCSSELASYWLFPRIHPTFAFGAVHFGKYATVESRKA
eukprot:TRINITY_DN5656_c0_g1_i1.p1 TRINITY_DN5656_c0_g1~~TRINITY_DN5656_c0_g1_i1.p1  ORF type:complete len:109 (+),score=16.19 TRINITY_DN5656_c0_g1_i1:86-412(+)